LAWYGKHSPGFEWTADCLVLSAGTHPIVTFELGNVAFEAPEQATKTTALKNTVKILSQFIPPQESIPLTVESESKRSSSEQSWKANQVFTELDLRRFQTFLYPCFDESAILKCEPVKLRV